MNNTNVSPPERLIELNDVYKIYGEGLESEVRALDGVSLTIDRGEFTAIIGSSGSGKSTMMNILGCLDLPTYGEYYLNDELVSELSDTELSKIRNREIGFIFQGFNLIPALTALENVELPLIYAGASGRAASAARIGTQIGGDRYLNSREELAYAALERVGIDHRAHHRPSEMSGGQQQRVAIARAIVTQPPLILADEPTGNLDSKTTEDVMKILRELHASGSTVVLITHDREIAEAADRTVRLLDGRIVYDSKRDGDDGSRGDPLGRSASAREPNGASAREPHGSTDGKAVSV